MEFLFAAFLVYKLRRPLVKVFELVLLIIIVSMFIGSYNERECKAGRHPVFQTMQGCEIFKN
jgi:predicted tellurium resistance membrane protein TerC